MAYGRKCYCCGERFPRKPEMYYCDECITKLNTYFAENENTLDVPNHWDHCISCGEWENRKIVYSGQTGLFPDHDGDGLPICNVCIGKEYAILKKISFE